MSLGADTVGECEAERRERESAGARVDSEPETRHGERMRLSAHMLGK